MRRLWLRGVSISLGEVYEKEGLPDPDDKTMAMAIEMCTIMWKRRWGKMVANPGEMTMRMKTCKILARRL